MQGDVGLVLEDAKGFSHVLWKKNLEDNDNVCAGNDNAIPQTPNDVLSSC